MKILKNIVIALVVLVAALALIGMLLPSTSKVERSLVINAPAEVIFDQVNDLKKNEAWSPWKDPTMVLTYGAVTEGKGAVSSWTSKDMGHGSMTIVESNPASAINIDLDFGGMGQAKALWSFTPEGEGVKVTETMVSDAGMNPAKRLMSLMSDKMVGPYFEKGLASLKTVSEARAAEIEKEKAATAQAAATPVEEAAPAGSPAAVPAPVPAAKVK
jgi:ribosome-associated toxin RatA of RatAB toxin-antitoxin module